MFLQSSNLICKLSFKVATALLEIKRIAGPFTFCLLLTILQFIVHHQDARDSYAARHYAGSSNTVAPPPINYHNQNGINSMSQHVGFTRPGMY